MPWGISLGALGERLELAPGTRRGRSERLGDALQLLITHGGVWKHVVASGSAECAPRMRAEPWVGRWARPLASPPLRRLH
eukprot:3928554-Pyramimonas_sp.AAC.1